MGGESLDVHRAAQLSRGAPWVFGMRCGIVLFLVSFLLTSGLYRGTSLALVGVSNGTLQFMAYEKMSWAFERKRRWVSKLGRVDDGRQRIGVSASFICDHVIFGSSDIGALCATYPYQLLGLSSNITDDRSFSVTSFVTTLT
ncbi:hypothetical protein EDB89DRAFT_2243371 [Lactarius sanguifluus]|nr:hypothetical protein EDB89DRAFT_2243371 [Lactarius sanguifluus]